MSSLKSSSRPGTYKLANVDGQVFANAWNIQQPRLFYRTLKSRYCLLTFCALVNVPFKAIIKRSFVHTLFSSNENRVLETSLESLKTLRCSE
jgi:hypothetical protein